ncbi:hypothetical protein [Chondrinema litorale]|nr:hypothetical protein [Chondrinema litorale]UZS00221.1 hypothetical protein OQ292_40385 [Chondrinema litorale]
MESITVFREEMNYGRKLVLRVCLVFVLLKLSAMQNLYKKKESANLLVD